MLLKSELKGIVSWKGFTIQYFEETKNENKLNYCHVSIILVISVLDLLDWRISLLKHFMKSFNGAKNKSEAYFPLNPKTILWKIPYMKLTLIR